MFNQHTQWPQRPRCLSKWLFSGLSIHVGFILSDSKLITWSSEIEWKICYREDFDRCKIHRMDKICLELSTFDKFATAFWPSESRDVCHHVITFLNHVSETDGAWNGLKKTFQQTSEITVSVLQIEDRYDQLHSPSKLTERSLFIVDV